MVDMQILKRFPHFSGLDQNHLRQLASISQEQTVPAGTLMFKEGDEADHLYIIMRGEVLIQYPVDHGRCVSIQTLMDGDILVWSAIVEPYKAKAMGTTTADTHVLAIDAEKLRELLNADPVLAHNLMHKIAKMLAERLGNAREKLATLSGQLEKMLSQLQD